LRKTKRGKTVGRDGPEKNDTYTRMRPSIDLPLWQASKETPLCLLLLLVVDGLAPPQLARAARSDETDLLAGNGVAAHGRRVANVLVVATTVRVLDRVHRHTTRLRTRRRHAHSSATGTRVRGHAPSPP
jgi:hypothetical protein